MIKKLTYFSLLFLYTFLNVLGQSENRYFEAEVLGGYIVPNHRNYPSIGPRTGFHFNIGKTNDKSKSEWGALYNGPDSGVILGFSPTGNSDIFGYEFSFLPFLELHSDTFMPRFRLRVGLGGSYFTKSFDTNDNPRNLAVGSRLTWNFKAFAYLNIFETDYAFYRFGFGAYHSSNAHVQLPNFGLNSAMLTLSARFKSTLEKTGKVEDQRLSINKSKSYFITANSGMGLHEFGGTAGSDIKEKRGVFSITLAGGVTYRQFIKVRTGFSFRYYYHYKNYILESVPEYIPRLDYYSTNVFWLLGTEFLLGRVGLNVEGGINLHKPFYEDFYEFFEGRGRVDYILKNLFPATLGINYWIIDPSKKPRQNIFIGANIRANFGQADYSDLVIGYNLRL